MCLSTRSINFFIMLDSIFPFSREHWLSISLLFLICYLARAQFHNGLQKYPGPFLASFTDWWRFFDVLGRRPEVSHIELHRKHGDIVRLGPNCLSFADPKALRTIYGLNKGFTKVGLRLWCRVPRSLHTSQHSTLSSKHYPKVSDYPPYSQQQMNNTIQSYGDA